MRPDDGSAKWKAEQIRQRWFGKPGGNLTGLTGSEQRALLRQAVWSAWSGETRCGCGACEVLRDAFYDPTDGPNPYHTEVKS